MEVRVRLPVNVEMPVLIVDGGGGLRVEPRKEGRVRQVELRHAEVVADEVHNFILRVSETRI